MVHEAATDAPAEPIEPGPVARLFQSVIPSIEFEIGQSPLDEVITVRALPAHHIARARVKALGDQRASCVAEGRG